MTGKRLWRKAEVVENTDCRPPKPHIERIKMTGKRLWSKAEVVENTDCRPPKPHFLF